MQYFKIQPGNCMYVVFGLSVSL